MIATLVQDVSLKHRANLGEEVETLELQAGTELTVLKEWRDHYLCKDAAGNVFNVRKQLLRAD